MRILFVFLALSLSFQTAAQKLRKRKIDRTLRKLPALSQAHVAVAAQPVGNTKLSVQRDAAHYMTPASNTKLLSFLAAVQQFQALPKGYYHKDTLGRTHFKSSGYPLLFHPKYTDTLLAEFLKQQKELVYHPAPAVLPPLGSGWSWDDFSYYYSAARSPLPLYGNVATLYPQQVQDTLFYESSLLPISVDTLATTAFRRAENSNNFTVNPQLVTPNDTLYRPFIPNDRLTQELLEKGLGIPVNKAEQPLSNSQWDTLWTPDPTPLYKALLHHSDNLVAESLLLMVGQQANDTLATAPTIARLQQQWASWLPDPLEWVDGSGVSRYNMVTPRSLLAVLQQIYTTIGLEGIQQYFPLGGVQGTLKAYRLPEGMRVYAKTGTLRHNHNLSGYFQAKGGQWYAFSIMVNHYTAPTAEIRHGISALLTQLYKKL
jgi:D-alanyl-D-alanine carboxypeptidase/D-alanyl-D-alanine-endopeptidase (penicillin-binding protein 4)